MDMAKTFNNLTQIMTMVFTQDVPNNNEQITNTIEKLIEK
jgi:hypothetical protein